MLRQRMTHDMTIQNMPFGPRCVDEERPLSDALDSRQRGAA